MLSEDDIERIDSYYNGSMNDDTRLFFEKKRASDQDFDREVEVYLLMMAGIKTHGEHQFSEKVKQWERKIKEKEIQRPPVLLKRVWAVAASVLILVIPLSVWLYSLRPVPAEQRFEEYFQPYDDIVTDRSSPARDERRFTEAMHDYNAGDYAKAIPVFNFVVSKKPQNEAARFYRGVAYLATGDAERSEKDFLWFKQKEESLFFETAQWYLVLVYLKQNKMTLVRQQLATIMVDPEHSFIEEAKALSQDL